MSVKYFITGFSSLHLDREKIYKNYARHFKWEKGRKLNFESKLVLLASQPSIQMSGIDLKGRERSRIGLVLATTYGGMESYEEFYKSFQKKSSNPNAFTNSLASMPSGVCSIYYDIKGPVITILGEGLAGIDALTTATDLIDGGLCETVIIGAWYSPSLSSLEQTSISTIGAVFLVLTSSVDTRKTNDRFQLVFESDFSRFEKWIKEADFLTLYQNKLVGKKQKETQELFIPNCPQMNFENDIPGVSSLLSVFKSIYKLEKNPELKRGGVYLVDERTVSLGIQKLT